MLSEKKAALISLILPSVTVGIDLGRPRFLRTACGISCTAALKAEGSLICIFGLFWEFFLTWSEGLEDRGSPSCAGFQSPPRPPTFGTLGSK